MKWTGRRRRRGQHQEDARWIEIIRTTNDRQIAEEAYRRLMQKYWQVVTLGAAQRVGDLREAEDVAQNAFVRAFRSLDSLKEPTAFLGWLLRIANNMATDHLRSRKSTVSLDTLGDSARGEPLGRSGVTEPDYQEDVERKEEIEQILSTLSTLPERYREVITLKYLLGMDGRTMAAHLGEPEGTVRNRLFRALEKLRENLEVETQSLENGE